MAKISDLTAATSLDSNNYFITAVSGASKKVSMNLLSAQINNCGNYPFDDAVELDYSWSDIKSMCNTGTYGDFQDIRVGDYKTITVNSETVIMEVAGINCYYNSGDSGYICGAHIDWISRDCYSTTTAWNSAGHNNGTSTSGYPWLVSTLYTFLNSTVYGYLPSDVTAVISNRRGLLEYRYTSGSTSVTDSTSWGWNNIGYLWVPSEVEVYGRAVWSDFEYGYSNGETTQYPIFRDGWAKRVKGAGNGGDRCWWWLRNCRSGSSTGVCRVGGGYDTNPAHGFASWLNMASSSYTKDGRVPLCFRIQAD